MGPSPSTIRSWPPGPIILRKRKEKNISTKFTLTSFCDIHVVVTSKNECPTARGECDPSLINKAARSSRTFGVNKPAPNILCQIYVLGGPPDANIVGTVDALAAVIPGGEEVIVIGVFEDDAGLNRSIVGRALCERGDRVAGEFPGR